MFRTGSARNPSRPGRVLLPELLRQVQAGKQFTTTTRGKAIADLVPSQVDRSKDAAAAIDQFLAFKKAHPVRPGS